MQKVHDIVLGPRVQAGGHLVANQEPGIGHQFHGQRQAPLLSPGKNLDVSVCNPLHARYLQGVVNAVVQIVKGLELAAELGGALHIFIHAQLVIGNAELGDEPDFRRFKILFRQIMPIPEKTAVRLRNHARNGLQQRGLSAAGRPHDRHEMPLGHIKAHIVQQFQRTVLGLYLVRNAVRLQHNTSTLSHQSLHHQGKSGLFLLILNPYANLLF